MDARAFVRAFATLSIAFASVPAGVALAQSDRAESARYEVLANSGADFASAVAAHKRGDLAAAARTYRLAIAKDKAFVEAMVNLAKVQLERGEFSEAAAMLDRAESLRPEYPGVPATRGLLALTRGDAREAVDALTRARVALPRDVEILTNLAAGLMALGADRKAIELLAEVLRLDPHRAEAVYNLGLAYDRVRDVPRAVHHYTRYLRLADDLAVDRAAVAERLAVLRGERTDKPNFLADDISPAERGKEG